MPPAQIAIDPAAVEEALRRLAGYGVAAFTSTRGAVDGIRVLPAGPKKVAY